MNKNILLFILAIVQFTHIVDFMIIMPLGKQFMEIFDINPQQFSLIVSSYAIAAFASGILSAMYVDRFDRKKALLFCYVGFTIGTLLCSIATGYYSFLMYRSFTGAFGGILSALVLSIVADTFPLEKRASAMGLIMTAFSVASVLGVPAGIFFVARFNLSVPFFIIGGLSMVMILLVVLFVPSLTKHIEKGNVQRNPFKVLGNIFKDINQLKALLFTMTLMLGHFTIIPFIAPYMQMNIGFTDFEVTYIYLFGGLITAVSLPMFGKIADKYGNAKVFTFASFFALFSIFAITNISTPSIILGLCVTSSYFIASSGRSVPATTMVTSVVKPEARGSFMSIRSSINELSLGLASFISGLIVIKGPEGTLLHYEYVGYIAIFMSIIAVFIAQKLQLKS